MDERPEDSCDETENPDKERILDLDGDGHVSMAESLRARAGLVEEYAKIAGPRRGPLGWVNRWVARLLNRVDND